MTNSLIPDNHEIRVLLTIKNVTVTERRLRENEIVATPAGFIEAIRNAGKAHDLTKVEKE